MRTRLQQLEVMLSARTVNGKPIRGYNKNVAAIHREISRLKTPIKPAGAR